MGLLLVIGTINANGCDERRATWSWDQGILTGGKEVTKEPVQPLLSGRRGNALQDKALSVFNVD